MIGQNILNYKIIRKIGEGGMGVVYLGEDDILGRKVAIKILRAQLLHDKDLLERFKSEARILSRLNHPNIASLYNFFSYENTYCMVMEYVEGEPLDDLLKKHHAFPAGFAAQLINQALEGLSHAHGKGIVHRDIKLSNLILSKEGEVKIMDFGIARAVGSSRLTSTGKAIGTLEYMSPEQIKGKEGDEKSDLYSMGIVLYELLSGDVPFQENTEFDLMKAHLEKKPPALRKKIGNIPAALEKVVFKCLEKKPEKRFGNAQEFKTALLGSAPPLIYSLTELEGLLQQPTQVIQTPDAPPTGIKVAAPNIVASGLGEKISQNLKSSQLFDNTDLSKKIFFGTLTLALIILLILLVPRLFSPKEKPQFSDAELTKDSTADFANTEATAELSTLDNKPEVEVSPTVEESTPEEEPPIKKPTQQPKPRPPKKEDTKPEEVEPPKEEVKPEPPKVVPSSVNIPGGTSIVVALAEDFDVNQTYNPGKKVTYKVQQAVTIDGFEIIKKGALAYGYLKIKGATSNNPVYYFRVNEVMTSVGKKIEAQSSDYKHEREDGIIRAGKEFRAALVGQTVKTK